VGRDAIYGYRSDLLALISGQPDRRKMAAVLRWLYFQHHFRFSGIWQIKILKKKYPGPGSRPSNALPPPAMQKVL
jgi:hypothetical protein